MEEKQLQEVKDTPIKINKKSQKNKQQMPKEVLQQILKKIFKNLIVAILIMLYFVILNLAYSNIIWSFHVRKIIS